MRSLHSLLPDLAQREVRCIHVLPAPDRSPASGLPPGEYAFVEFFCDDLNCDCRRVFIQVIARHQQDQVLASINYGWEPESFYRERLPHDPEAPREIVQGSLDPFNAQSEHSAVLLEVFQQQVRDEEYRRRLQRHYELFREELRRRSAPEAPVPSPPGNSRSGSPEAAVPAAHRERFREVAALVRQFGQQHLDEELTGFVIELWKRMCRRRAADCLRGSPAVWAASVTHVIARMNFLFDRAQPVHLTFDIICNFFQTSKTTVGGKATQIERALRLRQHCEPGLCRRIFLETFTNVRLSNGMVLSWKMAKEMGFIPADANVDDLP
jgi:hypothetical protein